MEDSKTPATSAPVAEILELDFKLRSVRDELIVLMREETPRYSAIWDAKRRRNVITAIMGQKTLALSHGDRYELQCIIWGQA